MRNQKLVVGVGVCLIPFAAASQDADSAQMDPSPVVQAARGSATPAMQHTVRYRGGGTHTTDVPIHTVQGTCYELVGYSTGVARVQMQVLAHDREEGPAFALENSSGVVTRQRFCAAEGGNTYALRLSAEGPTWWAIAMLTSGLGGPSLGGGSLGGGSLGGGSFGGGSLGGGAVEGSGRRGVHYQDPSSGTSYVADDTHPPIGGMEQDALANQIRAYGIRHPYLVGLTPIVRRNLTSGETYDAPMNVASGRCVDLIASAMPSVTDLVLEIRDAAGSRVAGDNSHQSTEMVHFCPPFGGTLRLHVQVTAGAGPVAVQALTEP